MGIRTVAIFSEADRQTPHVWEADEAYLVGPAKAQESYLNIERIIAIARQAQVDAIHPGYGFLSENAAFATAVTDAGIHFIGPSPQSIAIMGNKITAKQAVIPFEVPLIPGTEEAIHDPGEGLKWAERIGYPVLIKAAAGGGGKGMRMVNESADFAAQVNHPIRNGVATASQCHSPSVSSQRSVSAFNVVCSMRQPSNRNGAIKGSAGRPFPRRSHLSLTRRCGGRSAGLVWYAGFVAP